MLWGCWHGRGTLTIPFNFLDLEALVVGVQIRRTSDSRGIAFPVLRQ